MEYNKEMALKWEKQQRRGKIAGGLLVVTAGAVFLAKELGAEMPQWIFTWKTLLIAFGLVGFFKHGFQRIGWLIPMLVGGLFLVTDLYPEMAIKPLLWPIFIILVGLVILFKPRKKYNEAHWNRWQERGHGRNAMFDNDGRSCTPGYVTESREDFIDATSVMGSIQKNILSKNFKGGEVTNVFGGTELNLSQADFEGTVELEVTLVFGGTKLIVPSNWQIQSNIVTILGGIEDKRPVDSKTGNNSNKTLILNGTIVCGGIQIQTF